MTTPNQTHCARCNHVVEAYRLDRYDNFKIFWNVIQITVVEAYRLDRYDNYLPRASRATASVVEAYRLDRYDNPTER